MQVHHIFSNTNHVEIQFWPKEGSLFFQPFSKKGHGKYFQTPGNTPSSLVCNLFICDAEVAENQWVASEGKLHLNEQTVVVFFLLLVCLFYGFVSEVSKNCPLPWALLTK